MAAEHIHLIGIGGTGMTSLAGLLQADGCRVTGSDGRLYPPTSTILEALGLEVGEGFDPARLDPAPDLVVVGNAISRGNPEVEALLERRLPYTSMPHLIGERFLAGRHSVVVAGTHGKTTTASMLAWVLHRAGRDPGFLIGGAPLNFDRPFEIGSGPFVIEGDEYDTAFFDKGPKFMHYRPVTALVGTVEFDHADIFHDMDEILTAFRRLVNLVPRNGRVIRYEGSPHTVEATSGAFSPVEGYGLDSGAWRAVELEETAAGTSFTIRRDGEALCRVTLRQGGEHNVRNALAVAAAATALGLEAGEIADGLDSFRGVRRRLELRGSADGVEVFDDFAHHPTAILETLHAVRRRVGHARVWAVLEPRSWSLRRNVFQQRLTGVFDAANEIVLAPVFGADAIPAAERLDVERLVGDLQRRGAHARHLPDVARIVELLVREARPGDRVVVMSNGGFDGLHERLLEQLRERSGAAVPPAS